MEHNGHFRCLLPTKKRKNERIYALHPKRKQCENYIAILKGEIRLIAAQPIAREGTILKKAGSGWTEKDIANDKETQVGYYHILASDLDEAIKIARKILNLNRFLQQQLK